MIISSTAAYLKEPRVDWVRAWPGQAVLAVSQFYWTAGVQEAIKEGGNVIIILFILVTTFCICYLPIKKKKII